MGRRNRRPARPQADKRLRLVAVRRDPIDQRRLGRLVLRIAANPAGDQTTSRVGGQTSGQVGRRTTPPDGGHDDC
jgi:hypothetical protein